MNVLNKLSLGQKMATMVAVLVLPSIILLWQTAALQSRAIETAELELQGVQYAVGLAEVAVPIANHRGLTDLYLGGNHSRAPAIITAAAKADAAIASLTKLHTSLDPRLRSDTQWRALSDEWAALKQQVLTLAPQESDRRHVALLHSIDALNARVVNDSRLAVDPEVVSHSLMDTAIVQVLHAQMDLFALRGALSAVAGLDKLPHAVRAGLAARNDAVGRDNEALSAAIERLAVLRPGVSELTHRAFNAYAAAASDFVGTVQDGFVLTDRPEAMSNTAFALGTMSYETASELRAVLVPLLQQELQGRLSAATWMRNGSLFGGVFLLAIAVLFARASRLNITGTARAVVVAIEDIANGKVGRQLIVNSADEFGQVLAATNRLDAKLVAVVAAIRATANTVDSAATELTLGNDNLSNRTQQLAASIEETASSMEQMTATVKQNADNAIQANRLVASARQQAERGGVVVGHAVSAMNEINTSSRKIADIIGVIDEIAFQTNLLALNAAVEAARAGEQGRGFAVVATEVRNLAQRSASAAKEIKALINDSVGKVKSGADLVNESGKTLAEIMESVRKATDVVADIAAASGEQSSGIEQVNLAITQMDNGTQENAALVEESAAASKTIHSTVRRLVDEIAFFKVYGQTTSDASMGHASSAMQAARAKAEVARETAPLRKASGAGLSWQEF